MDEITCLQKLDTRMENTTIRTALLGLLVCVFSRFLRQTFMIELSNMLCRLEVCSIHHRRIERKFNFCLYIFPQWIYLYLILTVLEVEGGIVIRFFQQWLCSFSFYLILDFLFLQFSYFCWMMKMRQIPWSHRFVYFFISPRVANIMNLM